MNDFIEWLEDLGTQTLTDELKEDIIDYVSSVSESSYIDGYRKASEDAIEYIKSKVQ